MLDDQLDSSLKTNIIFSTRYLVAVGNLDDGLSFYGPFETIDGATTWAEETVFKAVPWRVHPLSKIPFEGN